MLSQLDQQDEPSGLSGPTEGFDSVIGRTYDPRVDNELSATYCIAFDL